MSPKWGIVHVWSQQVRGGKSLHIIHNSDIALREKCRNTELFLVRIFLYSDWIRRDTPCLSVFSPITGKYGTEMAPYLDTSCNVGKGKQGSNFLILLSSSYNFIKLQTQVKVYKTSLRDFLTLNGYWSFTVGFHVLVWSWSL